MVIRSPVMKTVLVVLASLVLLLVYAEDVTTSEYQDSLPVAEINARQNVDTGVLSGDNRQSRISTHVVLSSSKAQREQALRNLLAARRRRMLNQRPAESSHLPNRAFKSGNPSKDSGDILEAQETRNRMYVTAPADTPTIDCIDKETSETPAKKQNGIEKENVESKSLEIKQAIEEPIETSKNQNTTLNDVNKSSVSSSRDNNSTLEQDSNTVSPTHNVSSHVATIIGQKNSETDSRKKNTFVMPESLYNHFRPVESNIPIEDMSQFLYFGQKLHPEVQNTTNNNSVEVTPTVPTVASSRRRYSMKRYSTTTAMPVPKLEDIMNEEMNIAVERQTVEKNTVSKIKNTFRSPGNGIYYRKPRPVDATIVSNIIAANDSGRNSTVNDVPRETHTRNDKPPPNSSAHARDQLQRAQERGSATHVHDEMWNATDSTQILAERRRLSTNANDKNENEESSTAKSEIATLEHTLSVSSINKSIEITNGRMNERSRNETNRDSKESKVKSMSTVVDIFTLETNNEMDMDTRKSVAKTESPISPQIIKTNINRSDRKDRRAGIYQPNVEGSRFPEMSVDSGVTDRHRDSLLSRESNNIETSTSGEKMYSKVTWTTTAKPAETSTLRIVVTEVNLDSDFTTGGLKTEERDTVKPVDSAEEGVRTTASVDLPSLESAKTTTAGSVESVGNGAITGAPVAARIGATEEQQQQQAQHVYAYTITNVTRLLRNYTGPGLSKEEQGGLYRRTGTAASAEITTGAGQYTESAHQQHLQQKPEQQEPSAQSSPLPRAGSIDSAQSPAELSTGTTVVQARTTATAATPLPSSIAAGTPLVGERPRKVAPAAQYSQRAQSRPPIHLHPPAVNKIVAPARTRLADGISRGSVRWNHTKPRNSDIDGANDRRFLRKSASAVLNQRIGSNAEDEFSISNNKRRRVLGNSSFSQGNNRRAKGSTSLKSIEGVANLRHESTNFNDSVADKRKNSVNDKEDEVNGKTLEIMHLDRVNKSEDFVNESPSMWTTESLTDYPLTNLKDDKSASDDTVKNDTMTMDSENVTKYAIESNTKDESGASKNKIKSSNPEGKIGSMTEVNGGSENVDQRNRSSAGSATDKPKESDALKELTQTTTVSGPIFPVTPRILTELSSASPKETFTLNPSDSVNHLTEVKYPNGSEGKAIELDPSEIQKMYRSSTTPRTEVPTTTIPSNVQNKTRQVEHPEPTLPATYKPVLSTSSAHGGTRKYGSVERSPEVRGRNLSDKTKDKDDVLPIMHLYNTSSIFNGSASIDEVPLDADSPRLVLPTNDETTENAQTLIPPTTPISNDNDVKASTGNASRNDNRSNPSRVPLRDSKDITSTQASAKKNRQDELRDTHISQESTTTTTATMPPSATTTTTTATATTTAPTTPTTTTTTTTNSSGRLGAHGHSSGTGGNRTRHRPPPPPVYHHTILPDYNDSVYSSEINRTFFEAGLISAGPRDTVNISEVISKRHDGDAIASQETVAVVSYILATLVVFPIAVGVGLILRRLIIRNRKVLEESDTSSEISCRKDALNLENGDFKTSIEKAITKLPRIQHLCHEAEKPPPPPSQESRWEFPRDKLRLQTVLGQGNFGQVWKAEADDLTGHQGTTRLVAVKTVKEGASEREKEDLVRELEIMQQLGSHPNVVTLLGCCTEEEPHYLILEYVMYGKLLAYLRDHRTRQDFYNFSEDSAALTSRDLTVFGYCVARGMEYLASKKIIHRDLAARNVLVDHNKLCKIADFGMSRFANEDGEVIETRHGRNALPIRWMAPESLIYSLFTTKTDVWSFGILMWEIVTLGSTPYPDMTAREVMRNVQSGYRLERPSHCRSELFRVISRCWHADPDRRPEFQTLRRDLAQLLEDNMNGHYVDLESFASECTD